MGCQCLKSRLDKEEIQNGKEKEELESLEAHNIYNLKGYNSAASPNEQDPNNLNSPQDFRSSNNQQNECFDYPQKIVELINKIRLDPNSYADIIEDNIKNICQIPMENNPEKNKIIFKKKVKVQLTKGEPAFTEAYEILKGMEPLDPLIFKPEICVPLPTTLEELNDPNYLRNQVKIIREQEKVDVFFKDLIKVPEVSALLMIVDDSNKNAGKKRMAILSNDFKYIGVSSGKVGKTFVAYFTFQVK